MTRLVNLRVQRGTSVLLGALPFLLLLAFIGLSQGLIGRSLDAALGGVLFFTGIFVCVLLHEYGHALAARRRDFKPCPLSGQRLRVFIA